MKILTGISTIFTIIYLILHREQALALSLSDASFLLSLIFICLAMLIYVRNIGLFKIFAYNRYRRLKNKELKRQLEEDNPGQKISKMDIDLLNKDLLEFHEFCQENYGQQWSMKKYIIAAIFMYGLSFLFSYFL